jgi:transcriptional regulator with XRE-family HTH domain
MKYISEREFPDFLRQHVLGMQKEFAAELGISDAYLSMLLSGNKKPSPKILAKLGLARETRFLVTQERARVVRVGYRLGEAHA